MNKENIYEFKPPQRVRECVNCGQTFNPLSRDQDCCDQSCAESYDNYLKEENFKNGNLPY